MQEYSATLHSERLAFTLIFAAARPLKIKVSSALRRREMKARDLIEAGESAVAIFTRGKQFVLRQDGTGYTGNWVIKPKKKVDKVIIYKRDSSGNNHEVFVGTLVEIIDSEEEGRRQVNMSDIRPAGTTDDNWNEFTETKPGAVNPIKYISDRAGEPASRSAPAKVPETPRLVSSGSTITPSQLGDWRRGIVQLLPRFDRQKRNERESVGGWIGRLSREGVIPREVAAMMRTVVEMRNATEYESKTLSSSEVAAVRAAWTVVQEWARDRGFQL
jgi:hypothetical protein